MSTVSINSAEKVNYYVHLATAVIVVVDCAGEIIALMNGDDESRSDAEMISTGVKVMALGGNLLDAISHFTQSRITAQSSTEEMALPTALHGLRLVELVTTFNFNPLPTAVKLVDSFLHISSLIYNGCIFKWRATEIKVKKED